MSEECPEGPSKGKVLVAMPMLTDPNFWQTVVLLCEHGAEGSLGLVINRPTHMAVSTLIHDFPGLPDAQQVYAGGPVSKSRMLILCRGNSSFGGHDILEDVFLVKDMEALKLSGSLGANQEVRCYLGYAGWAAGQLAAELGTGAWRILLADSALIFDVEPERLWQKMIRQLGPGWSFYASMPADPGMN